MEVKKKKRLIAVLWIILFLIIWESLYRIGLYPKQSFPSLIDVINGLSKDLASGKLLYQLLFSVEVIIKSLLIGVLLTMLLTLLWRSGIVFESLVEMLISVAHPLPGIALLPVVILWFGVGEKSIIFIIVHSVLWPMLVNLMSGIKAVNKTHYEVGKNYGLSKMEMFFHILLPSSFPYFISGIRIGFSRAWRALISAEMIFGSISAFGGIGWYIFEKRIFMDTSGMYGGILIVMIIGAFMDDVVLTNLERHMKERWGYLDEGNY